MYKKSLIFIITISLILSSFQFAFADQKLIYEDSQNIKPKTNSFESKEDIKNVKVLDSKLQQSTTSSSIGLSDDSADGKYSLKVGVGNDGTANPYYINLMTFSGNDNLVTDCFGKIKLYVKPAQNAKELKFLINDKATSSFKIGDRLKSGQWNEIEIDLASISTSQKIDSLKAMVNQGSVWYFDKIELKREKMIDLSPTSSTPLKSISKDNKIAEQQTILNYGQSLLNNSIENAKISAIKISENTTSTSALGTVTLKDGIKNKIADDRIKVSNDGRYLYYIKDTNRRNVLYKYDREKGIEIVESDNSKSFENIKLIDINPNNNIALNVEQYEDWEEVSNVSSYCNLALKKDGTVWLCMLRQQGLLSTMKIEGLTEIKSISAGYDHFLALKKDGTVWAWGDNQFGQLGDGTTKDSETPVLVSNLSDVVSISAGDKFSCAVKKDGTVWMWGKTNLNKLEKLPTQIFQLKNERILSVCAFSSYGLAFSDNALFFINRKDDGINLYEKNNYIPSPFSISRGRDHLLILDKEGNVWSFGDNSSGQLGIGKNKNSNEFNLIGGLSNVIEIVAGDKSSFAIDKDGVVWNWGCVCNNEAMPKQLYISSGNNILREKLKIYFKYLLEYAPDGYRMFDKNSINIENIEINGKETIKVNSSYMIDKLQYISNDKLILKEDQFKTDESGKRIDTGIYRYRLLTINNNKIAESMISEDEYLNYLAMNGNEQKYFSYEKEQEKDDNAYVVSKYGADRAFGSSGNAITVTHTNTKGEKVTENLAVLKSSINSIKVNNNKDLLIIKTKPNTKTTIQNTTKVQTNETSTTTTSSAVQSQEKYDWYAVDVNKKTATLLSFDYDNGNITNIKDDGNVAELTYVAEGTTFTYRYDRLSGKIVNDESGLEDVKFNIYLNTKGPDGGYLKTKITSLKSNIIDMKANSKADTAFVKLQDHKWYMIDAKTKSARELKIDLNDPEIIYVSNDNKLYLYDANSRYMVFDVQTEELKDIRPADADMDKYLVAEGGRQIIYKSTNNELKVKYLDEITKDAGQYYLLSFDGKCTYQSYKNGRWITVPDSSNLTKESFEKYGMSLSEVNTLNKDDFNKIYINDRQIYSVDVAAMIKSGAYYGSQNISQIRCFVSEDDLDNKLFGEKTYMAKEENISLDNVRKINGINVIESVNLPTEYIYFLKKGDKYLTYNEKDGLHEGDVAIDSLLKDVRKNWIDLKLMGMTKAELINIPSEALTKEFITDATSGAAMKIVYAAKLDDEYTSKYKVSFRLSTTDNYFQSENLKIVIQQNDGKTKEYANLSKVQVEDFMEWVAGRQVNQGPIFYRLKSGNTNEFINYYMIVNVTVQE